VNVDVRIEYVDGSLFEGVAEDWASARADGVNVVVVANRSAQGHSLYWLYPEGDLWVTGEGSVRYSDQPLTEVLIHPDGRQEERMVEYMPDLEARHVKLGWWRPGEERPSG
jgi:hypothetical protein